MLKKSNTTNYYTIFFIINVMWWNVNDEEKMIDLCINNEQLFIIRGKKIIK